MKRLNSLILKIFCGLYLINIIGCATGAKSPEKANIAEILFGNNVQQYLAYRKKHLDSLQKKVMNLDEQTIELLGELHSLEARLLTLIPKTNISNAQLDELRDEVGAKKKELEQNLTRTESLKQQVISVSSNLYTAQQNHKADKEQLKALETAASELQEQTAILNRSVTRTLNLKTEQLLRNGI